MKYIIAALFLSALTISVIAQIPDTDIFLIEMNRTGDSLQFGIPKNITNRPGYDNQPVFSSGNDKVIYVSMPDTTQTDLFEYNILTQKNLWIAHTPESEYSPNFLKSKRGMSIVRVDKDKGQRLYRFENTPDLVEPIVKGIDSVGYYHHVNDTLIALAVLNNGMDMYLYNTKTHKFKVVASRIGRCFLTDPVSKGIIYTQTESDSTQLFLYNIKTGKSKPYCPGLHDTQDYAFHPSGHLWAGFQGKLYEIKPGRGKHWKEIADFNDSIGSFYRLKISSNGKYLALVAFKGERP